jgi:hypothetical protein
VVRLFYSERRLPRSKNFTRAHLAFKQFALDVARKAPISLAKSNAGGEKTRNNKLFVANAI